MCVYLFLVVRIHCFNGVYTSVIDASYALVLQLISGLAFSSFIVERGLPFRACDIFDDV